MGTENSSTPVINNEAQEWLSIPEASAFAGVGKSSLYRVLQTHPEIREKYCKTIKGNGRQVSLHISKAGMIVLANTKDTGRNLAKNGVGAFNAPTEIKRAKMALAEQAIETSKDPVVAQLEALLKMRKEMLGMQDQLLEVREAVGLHTPKIEDHEERIGGLETYINPMTSEMTQSQRSYLNSRVREYAFHMRAEYREVWSMLHDFVGRRSVDKYTMNDYSVAMGILKNKFKTASLPWSPNEYSKS